MYYLYLAFSSLITGIWGAKWSSLHRNMSVSGFEVLPDRFNTSMISQEGGKSWTPQMRESLKQEGQSLKTTLELMFLPCALDFSP